MSNALIAETSAIGTLRNRVVRFADSRYLPPDNPHLLKEAGHVSNQWNELDCSCE